MTKLDVLNEIASAITGTTVAAPDIKSAIDVIAAKGKGSAVSSETIAEALSVCDTYIENIIGGGADIQANKAVTITTNTVTEVTPDDGKDGMAKVTVTTDIPVPTIESNKAVTISNNGTVEITPTSGSDAMAKVTATVNVQPTPPEWFNDGKDSVPPQEGINDIVYADENVSFDGMYSNHLFPDGEKTIAELIAGAMIEGYTIDTVAYSATVPSSGRLIDIFSSTSHQTTEP